MRGERLLSSISPKLRQICIDGIGFYDRKCNNTFIKRILLEACFPNPVKRMLKDIGVETTKQIGKGYLSYPLPPKAKEVHFKILNRI